jgi:hypothetical protein
MRMINKLSFFLYFSCIMIVSAQQDKTPPKVYSVVVMPFLDDQNYPYNMDRIRESFIRAFYQKGFSVVMDDSTWAIILDHDFNPSKTLKDDAQLVSQSVDVDFIVFGQISNLVKQRGNYYTPNPISVSIYDTKRDNLIIKERMDFNERWGLMWKNFSYDDMALKVVNKLVSMGYK